MATLFDYVNILIYLYVLLLKWGKKKNMYQTNIKNICVRSCSNLVKFDKLCF